MTPDNRAQQWSSAFSMTLVPPTFFPFAFSIIFIVVFNIELWDESEYYKLWYKEKAFPKIKRQRVSSPQNGNSAIVFSPSCRSKPTWISFFYRTEQNTIFFIWKSLGTKIVWLPIFFKIYSFMFRRRKIHIGLEWHEYMQLFLWIIPLNSFIIT